MKCAKCKHRTDSRHHQYYCLGRRGVQIKRRACASRATGGRGRAASVLSFTSYQPSIAVDVSFCDRTKDQSVQS